MKYNNIETLKKRFPKGTIIAIEFDTRKCICIVDTFEFANNEDGDNWLYCRASIGLNASSYTLFNERFGITDNNIRYATDDEIDLIMSKSPNEIENILDKGSSFDVEEALYKIVRCLKKKYGRNYDDVERIVNKGYYN